MQQFTNIQKKIFPDLLEKMKQRYMLLSMIENLEPIGRRVLSDQAELTERMTRREVNRLQAQGLIEVTPRGMYVTKEGKHVLDHLSSFIQSIGGLQETEEQLKNMLQINEVIIVPGNSDVSEWVKIDMGKAAVNYLKAHMEREAIIAVTGGTTIAAVAKQMEPLLEEGKTDYTFVPARGGMDVKAEYQANTIVTDMAEKSNGNYRLLYVPDPLSESTYQSISKEPAIKQVLQLIQDSNYILHGIGNAIHMAKRRKSTESTIKQLEEKQALSEAFGYYFDKEGKVVHKVRTIGIQLEDVKTASCVIAVAGGVSKAKAIQSYFNQGTSDILITDEAAATEIITSNKPS